MICENCNARINIDQAEFCPKCGHRLVRTPVETTPLSATDDANAAEENPDGLQPVIPENPAGAEGFEKAGRPVEPAQPGIAAEPKRVLHPENFVKPMVSEEPPRALHPENFVKPMETQEPAEAVYPQDHADPVGFAEAQEPVEAVYPENYADPAGAQEPTEAGYQENFAGPAGEGQPVKRKGSKIVILLIVLLVLSAGVLAAVFLIPRLDLDGWPVFGTSESDSSSRPEDTDSSLPPESDSTDFEKEPDPGTSQVSSLPEPEEPTASDSQPDSQTPAPDASEEPTPAPSQPASEPAPAEPAPAQTAPAGPAPQPDDSEYVFPQSSSAYLTDADLAGLDKETLRLARNEICARHGKMFRDAELRAYFESKSWYSGTIEADAFDRLTNIYNAYEVANIALIQKYEAM